MNRKRLFFLGFAIVMSVITIYSSASGGSSPIVIPENAVVYTDAAAMELFRDESQWAMPDLLQQEVYLLDGRIYIDFWFSKKADNHQINNARSFTISAFVLRQAHAIGESPYKSLINNKSVEWQTASCRVYQGSKLLYLEHYDEKGQLIKP